MLLSDFDFTLPTNLIAQQPTNKRDNSDLLIVSQEENLYRTPFHKIINFLKAGDVIVLNNSKVIKAHLNLTNQNKKINFNLNKKVSNNIWRGFARPARKLIIGEEFTFGDNKITILNKFEKGEIEIEFKLKNITFEEFLNQYGQIPLPHYIKRDSIEKLDEERYQTVYNAHPGSVAAPTAGLHFTKELINIIQEKGVKIVYITLHVGAGTFLPVKTENINEHKMHSESYFIDKEAADIINNAKEFDRRIIAVGTTTLRTLESNITNGKIQSGEFETAIFIKPGFNFQIVDILLTNFHLPKTTLFMLVCAFGGYHEIMKAYQYAINNEMRFFSYGDAMLLYKKN